MAMRPAVRNRRHYADCIFSGTMAVHALYPCQ